MPKSYVRSRPYTRPNLLAKLPPLGGEVINLTRNPEVVLRDPLPEELDEMRGWLEEIPSTC